MNRARRLPCPCRSLLVLLLTALAAVATGCVYRPTIQQGNLLKVSDVDQVTAGMTRSQVRYLLGTPMISDPFDPQRWDYIYTLQRGHERHVDRAHFVVYFDGDKVSKVERLGQAALPDTGGKKKKASEPSREPPTPPSIQQRQPDAPRPGTNTPH